MTHFYVQMIIPLNGIQVTKLKKYRHKYWLLVTLVTDVITPSVRNKKNIHVANRAS